MGISIAPVSATQAKYYTNAVAKGKEDYYSGLGEAPPTRFSGRADGIYEIPEVVAVDSVAEMFKLQGKDDHRKIVAFDLTCSVPKSVSVMWAMADDETRAIIEKNLRIAAESAVGSMRWYAREGHAGARIIEVDPPSNMFDFRHRTSRALQPQLHSHIIVENRVWVEDRWLTVDSREVHAQTKNAGMVFDATLRRGLTEDLGLAWESTKASGASGDIRGVDKKLIAQWSSRRVAVEARLEEWKANFERETGRESTSKESRKAAQGFVLSTRQAKKGAYSTEDLLAGWQEEGRQFQVEPVADARAAAVNWVGSQRGPRDQIQDRLVGATRAPDPVSALITAAENSLQPTLNRWQLEVEARRIAPQNERETVAQWNKRIEGLCRQAVTVGELVSVYRPAIDASETVRDDGLPSEMSPRQERFATRRHIERERAVIEALAAENSSPDLAAAVANSAQIAVGSGALSEEQAAAITQLAAANTVGACLIGAPGVGKTTALGVVAEAAPKAGWIVVGLAATGKAAGEVQNAVAQGGGESSTIAAWLANQRREAGVDTNKELLEQWQSGTASDQQRRLFFLDEGSIASTEQLGYASAYCAASGSKLLIVGDHKQIGSVDRGGVLLAIATAEGDYADQIGLSKIPTATIETVVRQKEEWERRAAEALRRGGNDAATAINAYAEHDRIHPVSDGLAARREIASRMADDVIAGKESIAIGYTGNAVKELNAAVVEELVHRGELPQDKISGFGFRKGQRIITKKNVYDDETREMVVKNGEVWTVVRKVGLGKEAQLVVENLKTGEKRRLDKEYVEAALPDGRRQVQGGYATTPITIQSASLNGSSYTLGSEHATPSTILVPMTRGKESNHYFVPVGKEVAQDDPLIATRKQVNPEEDAIAWLKLKASEAPAENDKAAIQHVAQAENLAKKIKEAERAAEAARKSEEALQLGRALS